MTKQAVDRAWSIFEAELNRDADVTITRIRDMAAHGLVVAEKHLQHDQSSHTPTKYRAGAVSDAVGKLALLPEGAEAGTIENPLGMPDDFGFHMAIGMVEPPKQQVDVQINDLMGGVEDLSASTVEKYIREGPAGRATVVRYQGTDYVLDGNHRVTAAKLLGETSYPANLYDVDAEKLSAQAWEDLFESEHKHLLGLHPQGDHTPHKYAKGGKAMGLQPDSARQARWKLMLDDKETSMYHTNKAIRAEIEALEGGPEALRDMEKWYYNPGDPDQALLDPVAESKWKHEMDQLDNPDDWVQFEDWVYDEAERRGWNSDDDYAYSNTIKAVNAGEATPEQVEAMSAVYDYTQAHLKHRGVDSVDTYRGFTFEPEDAKKLKKGSTIRSGITGHWSSQQDVAEKFAARYYDRTPAYERPETTEVVVHKTFKAGEVFDYHLADATKFDKFHQIEEYEVVPIDGVEHKVTKVEHRKSRYGGLETVHVWVK